MIPWLRSRIIDLGGWICEVVLRFRRPVVPTPTPLPALTEPLSSRLDEAELERHARAQAQLDRTLARLTARLEHQGARIVRVQVEVGRSPERR